MSRFIRNLVIAAALVAVVSTSGVASASHHINNPVLRRQHPNVGFWKHAQTHQNRSQTRTLLVSRR